MQNVDTSFQFQFVDLNTIIRYDNIALQNVNHDPVEYSGDCGIVYSLPTADL